MNTDYKWSWTFIMAKGASWHCSRSCTLEQALEEFKRAGYGTQEIEAIIRH